MFTGLVEEVGSILEVRKGSRSCVLTIQCKKVLEDAKIGDSIAVNGVCLTVTEKKKDRYEADVMAETLNRSSLGSLKIGDKVNLERAMPINGRFGGHIVSGHIDGVGTVTELREEDIAIWYTIETGPDLLRYIVEKGSITIDGISLTVASVNEKSFCVSIIPHTRKQTNLTYKKVGDSVNLECDIIGKYVEKLMLPQKEYKQESKITEEFLHQYGF